MIVERQLWVKPKSQPSCGVLRLEGEVTKGETRVLVTFMRKMHKLRLALVKDCSVCFSPLEGLGTDMFESGNVSMNLFIGD